MSLPDATPAPNPNVVATTLADGQAVLLDLDTSSYIRLNQTAAVIWNGIEHGEPLRTICANLTGKFEVSEDQATRSLRRFLEQLEEAGLVSPR